MKLFIKNSYKKDYKLALEQGILDNESEEILDCVIFTLLSGKRLDEKFKDHALKGDFKGCRDCHIKSDLVLVYEISEDTLSLIRLGRHLNIFKNKK